jgi:hypothetical protein
MDKKYEQLEVDERPPAYQIDKRNKYLFTILAAVTSVIMLGCLGILITALVNPFQTIERYKLYNFYLASHGQWQHNCTILDIVVTEHVRFTRPNSGCVNEWVQPLLDTGSLHLGPSDCWSQSANPCSIDDLSIARNLEDTSGYEFYSSVWLGLFFAGLFGMLFSLIFFYIIVGAIRM